MCSLETGSLRIDNNLAQNKLRQFVPCRENFFSWTTVNGANESAIAYFSIENVKRNCGEQYAYIGTVVTELSNVIAAEELEASFITPRRHVNTEEETLRKLPTEYAATAADPMFSE
jgi:hypothetical protein